MIRSLRRQFRGSPAESFWRSSYWISLMSLQTCCNLWKRNKHISKHRNTYKKNHDKKKMLLHTALLHESLKKKNPERTEVGDLKETVVFTKDSKLLSTYYFGTKGFMHLFLTLAERTKPQFTEAARYL